MSALPATADDFDTLPDEMLRARRWLVWKRIPQRGKKDRKVPYYPDGTERRGTLDSPEDQARFGTFADALRALRNGGYAGLGFALGPDGTGNYWQGIDLDDFSARPHLRDLADELPGYTEQSPSGNGWHAFGYGRRFKTLSSNASGIEAYAAGRFFTVTAEGSGLRGVECLADFVERRLGPLHTSHERQERSEERVTLDPKTVTELRSALAHLRADDRGLWVAVGQALKELGETGRGLWWDWSQTSDKCNLDDARKWDSFDGDRTGYRAVFTKAQDAGWVNPASNAARGIETNLAPPVLAWPQGWPPPLDLAELAKQEPHPPRMIINDWLPAGYATLIAGHGGAGKSSIALYLAVCIALGLPFFGLPTQRRRVLYASCEDRADVLHWRLARVCGHLGVDLAGLAGHLVVLDLVGHPVTLWERSPAGGNVTGPFNLLAGAIREHGASVVFVDGVADVFGGNENDRSDVKRFVNALVGLIPPEDGALVLIHHVNKPAAGTGTTEGYSGSTGWHNSVRARWYLYPETESSDEGVERTGRLLLELQKSNLGRADQSMTFRWDEAAHLFVGELAGVSRVEQRFRDETEREGIIQAFREVEIAGDYVPAAMQGPRTAHHVLVSAKSFPETLKSKAAIRRFRRHIEHLRRIRELVESSIRRPNGHRTATLTLKAASGGAFAALSNTHDENATPIRQGVPDAELPNSAGGYRGCARAKCPACDGSGCKWCEQTGFVQEQHA